MRVLVVDDEPDVLLLCRLILEADGHEVRTAGDVPTGLAARRQARPDVVLLDFVMPGTDGLEMLERLRRTPDPPPVVMFSARGEPGDRLRGLAAGAAAYLTKPVDPATLVRVLEKVAAETPAAREVRRMIALATLTHRRRTHPAAHPRGVR
jgi:DNA-binding response OmpR family regulator